MQLLMGIDLGGTNTRVGLAGDGGLLAEEGFSTLSGQGPRGLAGQACARGKGAFSQGRRLGRRDKGRRPGHAGRAGQEPQGGFGLAQPEAVAGVSFRGIP